VGTLFIQETLIRGPLPGVSENLPVENATTDRAMTERHEVPPEQVTLVYREVGKTHVFTARELRGFHVGSAERKFAFEHAFTALSEHVSRIYGCHAEYKTDLTYAQFEAHLKGPTSNGSDLLKKGMELLSGSFVIAQKKSLAPSIVGAC
jgi:hypothetical protein